MKQDRVIHLVDLLPNLYRLQDAEQGRTLEAFLNVIGEQVDIVKRDIDGLYDDLFIETCRPWAIPYIGDLVGNQPIHRFDSESADENTRAAAISRADVGRTISYRRRKGTLPMIEELARSVTRWSATVVPFLELLAWTQNVNHVRLEVPEHGADTGIPFGIQSVATALVRDHDLMRRVGTAFDKTAHTIDVRKMGQTQGWHNVQNLGVFLWRIPSYPLEVVQPHSLGLEVKDTDADAEKQNRPDRYLLNPLGTDTQLFNKPVADPTPIQADSGLHVARPMRRSESVKDHYGRGKSLQLFRSNSSEDLIPAEKVKFVDLTNWDGRSRIARRGVC